MTTLGNTKQANGSGNPPTPGTEAHPPQPRPSEIRSNNVVASYSALLKSVRQAGLLRRRTRFYVFVLATLVVLLAGIWTGFAFLGDSWFQLLIAAGLGILFTQFAFWAHEAAHNQIFTSRQANAWTGRIVGTAVVG